MATRDVKRRIQAEAARRRRKERFLTLRMWVDTLLGNFVYDSGHIPPDLGDKVLIGTNTYTTSKYISSLYMLEEVPFIVHNSFLTHIFRRTKSTSPGIKIDITIKNAPMILKADSNDMKFKKETWERQLREGKNSEQSLQRAAMLMRSLDVLNVSKTRYRSRVFIWVSASNAETLSSGCLSLEKVLTESKVGFRKVKNDLRRYLEYSCWLSNSASPKNADIVSITNNADTLSELLPYTQGYNDTSGLFCGINRYNNNPYLLNVSGDNRAKNVYINGLSGEGKTFLGKNWTVEAFVAQFNCIVMDVKGTEFGSMAEACGGVHISQIAGKGGFINTFKLDRGGIKPQQTPEEYFKEMFRLSVRILTTIIDPLPSEITVTTSLLNEFIKSLYNSRGVNYNPSTWKRTQDLSANVISEEFSRYAGASIRKAYSTIIEKALQNFSYYLAKDGPGSEMFNTEYSMGEILSNKFISLGMGMLGGSAYKNDDILNRLKLLIFEIIMFDYVYWNFLKGITTFVLLEESQAIAKEVMTLYARLTSLARSMGTMVVVLGNSVRALTKSPEAETLIDNINVLVLGKANSDAKNELITAFNLEKERSELDKVYSDDERYDRTFLLINRITRSGQKALIRVYVPQSTHDVEEYEPLKR